MSHVVSSPDGIHQSQFLWLEPFLQAAGLPFARVLSEEEVDAAFAAEGVEFGQSDGSVFTPASHTWGLLSQVLHTGRVAFLLGDRVPDHRALGGPGTRSLLAEDTSCLLPGAAEVAGGGDSPPGRAGGPKAGIRSSPPIGCGTGGT